MSPGPRYFVVRIVADATVLRFIPRFLGDEDFGAVAAELSELMEDLATPELRLDLRDVEYVGERWLGKLVAVFKLLQARGQILALTNVGPQVYELLVTTRLAGLFDVQPKRGEFAVNRF